MQARLVVCALMFLWSLTATAQNQTPSDKAALREQIVEKVCRGSEVRSGPELEELHRVMQKLGPIINLDKQHRTFVALANNNEINAWATNFNMTDSMICVPVAMVHFMGDAEGELAFILAHEVGHTIDDVCKTQQGRLAVANSRGSLGAMLGGLLGGEKGAAAASRVSQQRGCEARADEIGFYIFAAAGFNPYDAAGAFGRLEMFMGDTNTGVLARLSALGSDHPMTPDRIKNMRALLIKATENSEKGQ
jgi:predicted Zn-dependent protease